jgi:hypothetical protein
MDFSDLLTQTIMRTLLMNGRRILHWNKSTPFTLSLEQDLATFMFAGKALAWALLLVVLLTQSLPYQKT